MMKKRFYLIMVCMAIMGPAWVMAMSGTQVNLFSKDTILLDLKAYDEPVELAEPLSMSGVCVQLTAEHDEIYELYETCQKKVQPVLITTDLLFHTLHKVFDYSLRVTEVGLFSDLQRFSEEMFEAALKLKAEHGSDEDMAVAADQLIAYFAVPNILLGNPIEMDASLQKKVGDELGLINAHKGFGFSKVLNQKEDYSQYVVRGHYTRNDTLEKYFLASMWYGRRMFRFDESRPDGAGMPSDTPELGEWWKQETDLKDFPKIAHAEILSACLLVHLIENTSVQGQPAIEIHKRLKSPFDVLVGRSEDITIETLSAAIQGMFGKSWDPSALKDRQRLLNMAKAVAQGNRVKIDATGLGRKGLTLLGQRFILDAAFFQKLVHSRQNPLVYVKAGTHGEKPFTWVADQASGEVRGFPRGMDIMAIFGSDMARDLLEKGGDADYKNYPGILDALKRKYENFKPSANVYEKMLHSFMPLFQTDPRVPLFMQSEIWQRKSLNTALGAWTELRHDTILYGKQSYTPVPRGGMTPQLKLAYLEPNPQVYRRLHSIVSELSKPGTIRFPEFLAKKYHALSEILDRLVSISENELKGAMPGQEDTAFLSVLSKDLKNITKLPRDISDRVTGNADSQMPLAADVHTRMPQALTEAVGYPSKIIVVIPVENKPTLFFGGGYSYYEFKVPFQNRLTDEKWKEELDAGKHAPVLLER